MRTFMILLLGATLVATAGCGKHGSTPSGDGGAADRMPPASDGGPGDAATDGSDTEGPAPLTLVGWVSDLVTNYTVPTALPDTVDDKMVVDTADPAAFDPLLAK